MDSIKKIFAEFVKKINAIFVWIKNAADRIWWWFNYIKLDIEEIDIEKFFKHPETTDEFLKALRNKYRDDIMKWNITWAKSIEWVIKEVQEARETHRWNSLDKDK